MTGLGWITLATITFVICVTVRDIVKIIVENKKKG